MAKNVNEKAADSERKTRKNVKKVLKKTGRTMLPEVKKSSKDEEKRLRKLAKSKG